MPHTHKLYLATPLEQIDLKAASDGWEFTAYASTFGNKDHGGDIIQKGAFKDTLTARSWRPLLWQHDSRLPIGIEKSIKEDSHGLIGTWSLLDTQQGTDAYKLLKAGAVRSMSIGYMPGEFKFEDNGETRVLEKVDLLENSIATIPMNDQAVVTGVKHFTCMDCGQHVGEKAKETYGRLNVDVPLDELLAQVKGYVIVGVDEAEALYQRRAGEQRKLTDGHTKALEALTAELKGSAERLEAILNAATEQPPETKPDAKSDDANGAAQFLRLEIARRRLRAAGVEV